MEYTVRLQDGADLQLTDVGVSTNEKRNYISFSIDGRLENIDDDLMAVFEGQSLRPLAITFETVESDDSEANDSADG